MRFLGMLFFPLLLASLVHAAEPRTADELIAKNLEARGGAAKIRALRSYRFTGTYEEGTLKLDFRLTRQRPRLHRVDWKVLGTDTHGAEGYDGSAWEFYSGNPSKVIRTTGVPALATERSSYFDDRFVDYREHDRKVEFGGRIELGGKPVYELRVTDPDGYLWTLYFDPVTWLVHASRKTAPVHAKGAAVESLTYFEDYRPVAGVLFPFRIVEKKTGSDELMNRIVWEKIEVNEAYEEKAFSPPEVPAVAVSPQ